MSPPQVRYLYLQFYGNCRSGRLPLHMSLGHLFIHQTKPMIELFLQSPVEKERVMKSVPGHIAGIRNIFGICCSSCIFGYNHKKRNRELRVTYYSKNRESRGTVHAGFPFAEAVPHYLCRLRTKATSLVRRGWVDGPHRALTEADTSILWEPVYKVKAAKPRMWGYMGWN